jgi:hypothetical protein
MDAISLPNDVPALHALVQEHLATLEVQAATLASLRGWRAVNRQQPQRKDDPPLRHRA